MKKSKCTLITSENIDVFKNRMVQFLNKTPFVQEQTTWLDTVKEYRFRKSNGLRLTDKFSDGFEHKLILKTNIFYYLSKCCSYEKSDGGYYVDFNDGSHSGDLIKIGDRVKVLPKSIVRYSFSIWTKHMGLTIIKMCDESSAKKNILRYRMEAKMYDDVCREEMLEEMDAYKDFEKHAK